MATAAEVFLGERQPEVGDLGPVFFVEQDVRGFDVAVDQSLAVGVVERLGRPGHDRHGLRLRRPAVDEDFG